jgi:acyl carrier protein
MPHSLISFVEVIRNQFSEEERPLINETTDIKLLKEWSSLQAMIIVNEIDKNFGVLLTSNNFNTTYSIAELYHIVQQKKQTN